MGTSGGNEVPRNLLVRLSGTRAAPQTALLFRQARASPAHPADPAGGYPGDQREIGNIPSDYRPRRHERVPATLRAE